MAKQDLRTLGFRKRISPPFRNAHHIEARCNRLLDLSHLEISIEFPVLYEYNQDPRLPSLCSAPERKHGCDRLRDSCGQGRSKPGSVKICYLLLGCCRRGIPSAGRGDREGASRAGRGVPLRRGSSGLLCKRTEKVFAVPRLCGTRGGD
jgi:hypothetical protein